MRTSKLFYAALLCSGVAFADAPLDVTIRVLESPRDLPDAVTGTIELPPQAAEIAREKAQPGLDRANEARGREPAPPGLDRAGEVRAPEPGPPGLDRPGPARSQGREFGQSVAEDARNHGNRGPAVPGRGPNGRGRP